MKRIAIIGFTTLVVVASLYVFTYFAARSADRARLFSTANNLLNAHAELRQNGVVTNRTRVQAFTNHVTIGGLVFQCELAAYLPELADSGSLVIATDATVIWIDKNTGPAVYYRRSDNQIIVPKRFRDNF